MNITAIVALVVSMATMISTAMGYPALAAVISDKQTAIDLTAAIGAIAALVSAFTPAVHKAFAAHKAAVAAAAVIVGALALAHPSRALADQPHTVGHPLRLFGIHHHKKVVKATPVTTAAKAKLAATVASAPSGTKVTLSSTPAATLTNPITQLANITLNDLQNALKVSNAQVIPAGSSLSSMAPYNATVTAGSDTRHGNCWAALIQFVTGWQAGIGNILPNQLGIATAAQTFFDDQSLVGKPLIPDYVVVNCALTVADLQTSFAQLALAVGIKAAPLPALPALPVIP